LNEDFKLNETGTPAPAPAHDVKYAAAGKPRRSKVKKTKSSNSGAMRTVAIVLAVMLALGALAAVIFLTDVLGGTGGGTVFTINGEVFTANDYYFQLYMTKRQVLNTSEILTRQFLDQKLGEITVEALLKDSVESALKVSAGVKVVAEENDIALTDGERGEIQKKKDAFIAELGGAGVLRDFLRNNRTSEKALDKYFEINALIDKVENELYSEGKLFDLTAAEVAAAKSEYDTSYARFNYIFFLMVDSSGEALSDRTKQGKRDLATEAAEKAALGENFTNLIKEYSEDASLQEKNGYDTYEVKSDGSDASRASYEDAIFNTAVNGVSGVKDLENGLVIIKRLPLDEGKFENHKSTARKAKLLNDIGEKVKGFFAEPGKEYNNIVIR